MRVNVSVIAASIAGIFSMGSANALVVNGDFSGPSTGFNLTEVSGWVTGGNVDVLSTAAIALSPAWTAMLNAKPGADVAGDKFMDLDGNMPGSISQTLATIAGTSYSLSFDFAASPRAGGERSFMVNLNWGSGGVSQVFTAGSSWGAGSVNFTPDGQTTLAFESLSPVDMPDGAAKRSGALLDNIAVDALPAFSSFSVQGLNLNGLDNGNVAPVPEPETYAMMLVGLGVVGFMARRRRKAD
jgi:hypothetical protein